jgi:hypothetical protein
VPGCNVPSLKKLPEKKAAAITGRHITIIVVSRRLMR